MVMGGGFLAVDLADNLNAAHATDKAKTLPVRVPCGSAVFTWRWRAGHPQMADMATLTQTLGFIGAGNMARAILGGTVRAGLVDPTRALASDVSPDQLAGFCAATGAAPAASNREVAEKSDIIIIATKPFHVEGVCAEVREAARPGQIWISICAGIRTSLIEQNLGGGPRVVRVMPNTPALIGCGAAGVAPGAHATPDDLDLVTRLFGAVGVAVRVEEDQLDLVTGLSGSGPAYVFRFAEALIEAATELGLAPEQARALALQTLLGSARMALESGRPLHDLRAAVTTKGGTTEAGLRALEEGDFSELIHDCVEAATRRSRELSGGK
jgi:pyrroline-5-carboxylate reductase